MFARAPIPGRTKTRLAPTLGEAGAARLYEAFLRDTLARLPDATVFFAAAEDEAWLAAHFGARRLCRQVDGSLGERMRVALEALREQADAAYVVGSDAPTLPAEHLEGAARALRAPDADVVLGPASDGGFYLLGCRGVAPRLDGVRWSTAYALADTLAAVARVGRRARRLRPWYDVDDGEDLRLLRAHLAVRPDAAPHTARALRALGFG